jgi:hypothetical protein
LRASAARAAPYIGSSEAAKPPQTLTALALLLSGKQKKLNTFEPALSIIHLSKDALQARTANKCMLVLFVPNDILAA